MDPVTALMFVAAGTSVASGVAGYQGAQFEKDVAAQNEVAAKREATVMAEIEGIKGREATGRARATAAASGLTVAGSATDVIGSLAAAAEFRASNAIYLGRRKAQQAQVDQQMAKRKGDAALLEGVTRAATILTSAVAPAAGPAGTTDVGMSSPVQSGGRASGGMGSTLKGPW